METACGEKYMAQLISLFSNHNRCTVAAMGGKAQERLKKIMPAFAFENAFSVAPPGCNHAPAKPSWDAIVQIVREKRNRRIT